MGYRSRLCLSFWFMMGLPLSMQAQTSSHWPATMMRATEQWDAFLQAHVNSAGGVDYQKILSGKGRSQLHRFLKAYDNFDPAALGDDAKKALYINLYNAGMIANILRWSEEQHIPVASKAFLNQEVNRIKTKGGNIWNGEYTFSLGGKAVHLDQIEHGLMRGKMDMDPALQSWVVKVLDPRIHGAVNCAAMSCPRLREKAYTPENVDTMLQENMTEWLSSPDQFAKISERRMGANQIVQWYYSDFDNHGKDVLKLRGAGDYLVTFIDQTTIHAKWKTQHLKAHFNDRALLALRLSSKFSFHYDWHIADARVKK